MKILVCHNIYQRPGGEDQVFADETALLEAHGHEVVRLTVHNDDVTGRGKIGLAVDTLWNREMYRRVRATVERERAEVVHFHNTFPLLSPAAYAAARHGGAAVVQTLHNYRLLCPGSLFLRDGKVCEDCLGRRVPLPAVRHKCYRNDRAASAVTVVMLTTHRALGTYQRSVDLYIALTEFSRNKFIEGGLPGERIVVKPNFVGTDRGVGDGAGDEQGAFGLYVGRLDEGKGIEVLLSAWSKVPGTPRLKILGDGQLAPLVRAAAERDPRIEWLGRRPIDEVYRTMGEAAFLVMPSVWYEAMPRTLVEAYSKGTPILGSRLGAMAELIEPGQTGLHFTSGSADDLAGQVSWAFQHPHKMLGMRAIARRTYEQKYTADENYRQLRACYETALERRSPNRHPSGALRADASPT